MKNSKKFWLVAVLLIVCLSTLVACQTTPQYKVSFVVDGQTYGEVQIVEEGAKIAQPTTDPTKENDAQYTYTFDGWYFGDKKWNFETDTVTEDVTLKATYISTVNKYEVVFKNDDVVLQNTQVDYGTMPEYKGETPTKAADNTTKYTFSAWSPEVKAVDGAATYVAQFTSATRTYEVAFNTDSDYTVESQSVEYDNLLTAPSALGYKIADDKYYEFAGWYNGESQWNFATDKVTADGITLTAHWTELGGIHNATYDGSKFSLTKNEGAANYTDCSYIELGSYENGGFVAVSFKGKVAPQIAFFISGGTSTMKDSATGCMLFTSDVVTSDYRMFPHTNPNTGAVMAGKWNKGAFANLDGEKEYVLIVSDVKGEAKYFITLNLYVKTDDGNITLVEGGTYTCDYPVAHKDLKNTGSKIVLFGSRHSNVSGTVVVADSLENAIENYTVVHTHYYKLVDEVAASCTTNGTKAHFTCSGCDKLFVLDEDDNYVEATAESLVILAGHNYGTLVESVASTCKDNGHVAYYKCSGCNKYFDENKAEISAIELPLVEHTYGDWIAEVAATNEANGTKGHYHCSVCEKNFDAEKVELETIVIPKIEHTYGDFIAEVAATCYSEGTLGHYHCSHCDKNFDKDYNELSSLTISKKAHSYGAWTMTVEPTETTTGTAEKVCINEGCPDSADGHKVTETVAVLGDTSVWTLDGVTYTSVYGTITLKIYKSTYNATTGALTTQACAGSTNYTDCSFVDIGEYANGAFVGIEFTGKYVPQIGFFLSGGTKTMKADALGGLVFSTDAIGTDYRMWKDTNVTTGAVLANKWNFAAYNNLTAGTKYVLVVGCVKSTRYDITLALYTHNDDGSITLVNKYECNYQLNDSSINNSGTHLVLFGSRVTALTAKVAVANTLEEITSKYVASEPDHTVQTYNSTYDATTGKVTLQKATISKVARIDDPTKEKNSYDDASYIDFGEYANGGRVEVTFTGKYTPQIGFFLSGGTKTMTSSALGGLVFSTDSIGTDYRMFKSTDVVEGAILVNQWNAAAYNNLTDGQQYKLVVSVKKTTSKYEIYLALYTISESELTLVKDYTCSYNIDDSKINNSGTHIVLFGSRITNLNATVTVTDSADL